MTDMEMLMKMAQGELPTGVEVIKSQAFTSADGRYTATAEISVLHEVSETGELGEIVNGGCNVTTGGGIVYSAETYRDALKMAADLVAHWDNGDFDWEPKKPQW